MTVMPLFMQDDIDCGRLPEQGRNVAEARRRDTVSETERELQLELVCLFQL